MKCGVGWQPARWLVTAAGLLERGRRAARKNDAAVDRMCSSIREFDFKIPCLVRSDGEVIDGHLRLKAARKLGITDIPVILCDEWTPAQVRAFRLLVNRSAMWANWELTHNLSGDNAAMQQRSIEQLNADPHGFVSR